MIHVNTKMHNIVQIYHPLSVFLWHLFRRNQFVSPSSSCVKKPDPHKAALAVYFVSSINDNSSANQLQLCAQALSDMTM